MPETPASTQSQSTGDSADWQPIPGKPGAAMFTPKFRSDPWSAQATLVRTPKSLLLIDPGCAAEQANVLSRAMAESVGDDTAAVVVVLTHAHWDHAAALPSLAFPAGVPVVVCAQSEGARILARGDSRLSLAFLFNADCPVVPVDAPLLPDREESGADDAARKSAQHGPVLISEGEISLPSGRTVRCERIGVGGEELARVFHTPGHSPDSICLQIGDLLWVGDLLLAANPAVAGVPGWDRDALRDSLETVCEYVETAPISLCCSGHGRSVDGEKALKRLSGARDQAMALGNIAVLDSDRVRLLVEYSEDLLSESLALFTILAGRLYAVSFHLDRLDEPEEAAKVLEALDADSLDVALDDLHRFAERFRKERRLEMALPIKAIQTTAKAEKILKDARLEDLVDPILLRRARLLLNDFMQDVRGIEPPANRATCEIRPLLESLVDGMGRSAERTRTLWDIDEDEQAFRRALTRNIAAEASAVHITIDLDVSPELPPVLIDRVRTENVLHDILSGFAGSGVKQVAIAAQATRGVCSVIIRPATDSVVECFTPRKVRFLDRNLRISGGALADAPLGETGGLRVDFPLTP